MLFTGGRHPLLCRDMGGQPRKKVCCDWPDCGKEYDRPAKLSEHKLSHTNEVLKLLYILYSHY